MPGHASVNRLYLGKVFGLCGFDAYFLMLSSIFPKWCVLWRGGSRWYEVLVWVFGFV